MHVQLTERQAAVVRLREEEKLSWREIGERLGISKSVANSSYRGAVAKRNAKPQAFAQTVEVKKPEQTAKALDAISDPFNSIRQAARQCGFPPRTVEHLIKRMRTRYAPLDAEIRRYKTEELTTLLEDRAGRALGYLDDFVLAQSSGRDLAVIAGVAIDKLQLLKGEATQIVKIEDARKMDELLVMLHEEMVRRGLVEGEQPGKLLDVTPVSGTDGLADDAIQGG